MDKPDKIFLGFDDYDWKGWDTAALGDIMIWEEPTTSTPDERAEFGTDTAYLLATPERELASELAGTLWQWLELAERTMEDHVLRFDANRAEDFWQGIRETKAVLAKLEGKG